MRLAFAVSFPIPIFKIGYFSSVLTCDRDYDFSTIPAGDDDDLSGQIRDVSWGGKVCVKIELILPMVSLYEEGNVT